MIVDVSVFWMRAVWGVNPEGFRRVASGYHTCGLALPDPGQAGPGVFFLMTNPSHPHLSSGFRANSATAKKGRSRGIRERPPGHTQLGRWTTAHCVQAVVTLWSGLRGLGSLISWA